MIPGINHNQSTNHLLFRVGYFVVFGLLFFITLEFVFDAKLVYYTLQPFFAFDSSYLNYYLDQHNGILVILSQFFLQFLSKPVFGSVLIVILLLFLAFIIYHIAHIKKAKLASGLEFIPSIMLHGSMKNYTQGIETLLLLIIAGSFVLLISVIPYRYYIFRILYHVAAVIIIYFIFGMMTSIAFTALGIVTEFFYCSKPIKYISILVSVAALFFLIYTHTGFTLAKIILKAAHASSYHAIMPLYWHCVIIIGVTIIAANLLSRAEFIDRIFIRLPLMFTQSISLIVLLILISVFYKHYFINPKKYNAQVEYYAGKQQWRKVLALKNKVALNDRISIFELNRALYHEGLMMEKLFIVPQNWGSNTLFLTIEFNRECAINSSDLYYDMGYIKGAQYWALEAQTYSPYAPRILQRFVQCAILLGDNTIARKYLAVLGRSPVYRKWSEKMSDMIKEKKTDQIRNEWFGDVEVDYDIVFINSKEPQMDLLQMLQKDSTNRMAVEYLLSYFMLECRVNQVEYYILRYGGYDPGKLPSIYQEALLFKQLMKNIPDEELPYTISNEIKNKMAKFNKVIIEYNFDDQKAKKYLYRLYGDTFWYYFRYISPLTTGSSIKKIDK